MSTDTSLRSTINWHWYYQVTRRCQKFIPWVARRLPEKLKYFVIVDVAVRAEPNTNPSGLTALELMQYLDKKGKING